MFNHIQHEFPRIKRTTNSDGKRVYETPSGKMYPSVTTVTGLHVKQEILAWRKRVGEEEANKITTRAAKRGTRIHSLCEDYLSNKESKKDLLDVDMWQTIQPHLDSINNIHALEKKLYSDHLEVAGTVDCIGEYKGKLSVIDFKTSRRRKTLQEIDHYFMQCSAYAVAFEEMLDIPVSNLVVIMAVDSDDCIIFNEKRDAYIDRFIDLRKQYKKLYNS